MREWRRSGSRVVLAGMAALSAATLAHADAAAHVDDHPPAAAAHAADAHAEAAHAAATRPAAPEDAAVTPDAAIELLVAGNDRFVAGTPARPNQTAARRAETFAGGQHPYAAVLSCADSRVPVELLFDAGVGDLFVVRVAGNVADVDEVGTIEYGVEHLGINVVVVLGHVKCGAVTAVVNGTPVTPNVAQLVDNITPAVAQARQMAPKVTGAKLIARAIRANVRCASAELTARSPLLADRVKSGQLKIVGGVYDLSTGEIEWLEAAAGGPVATGEKTASHVAPNAASSHDKVPHDPSPRGASPAPAVRAGAKSSSSAGRIDPHAAPATQPAVVTVVKKDNYLVLGGCLGIAGITSFGMLYGLKARAAARVPSEAQPTPAH